MINAAENILDIMSGLPWGIARTRIDFLGPPAKTKGTKFGASKNGTVFLYIGPDPDRFREVFFKIAYVLE